MARKITRVCEDAVDEVYGVRRVHRAGSRTCTFCVNYHTPDNTLPTATSTARDAEVEVLSHSDNIILRNNTTVTLMTVSLPEAGLNLFHGEENLNSPVDPSVNAFTFRLTDSVDHDASPRSQSRTTTNTHRQYNVLLTFSSCADTILP